MELSECRDAVVNSQTAADLETNVLICLRSKVPDAQILDSLNEKGRRLFADSSLLPKFLSSVSPNAEKIAGENGGNRRVSYLSSLTAKDFKPHIFHIGFEFNSANELLDVRLELTNQPI